MGLVALRHVGSSRTRARTRVPCIGGRILNHCTTREVLEFIFLVIIHELITERLLQLHKQNIEGPTALRQKA